MSRKIVLRYVFWAITLLIMTVVFLNSAKNADQSSGLSDAFTDKLFSVFVPDYGDMNTTEKLSLISEASFFIRKSAHFLSYFAMGLFCALAFNTYSLKLKTKFISSVSVCVAFAVSDEIHQLFVAGRSGEIRDVFIDSSGILLAAALTLAIVCVKLKRKEKKNERA